MIDIFINLHNQILEPGRIPLAMLALVLAGLAGVVTGPMHGNANPFAWLVLNKLLGGLGSRLDRRERPASDLLTRGFIFTVFALLLIGMAGIGAAQLALDKPYRGMTEIFLLSLTLTGGTVWYALLKLYFALKDSKMGQRAYYIIAHSTRVDLNGSDNYGITRTGMAFAARAFDKGVVAPVLWFLIAGLPGAYIYAGLAFAAWRFGKDGYTKGFGKVPLALEMLMGFVPSVLAGTLIALAGLFTPTGGMTRAVLSLLSPAKWAPYAEGGLPVSAMAYALEVSLGGPAQDLDGSGLQKKWIGPDKATAQLESAHLRRALYLTLMAYLLFMASLAGAMLQAG